MFCDYTMYLNTFLRNTIRVRECSPSKNEFSIYGLFSLTSDYVYR